MKRSFLLATATVLVISCNTETDNTAYMQAKADSIVNARVEQLKITMKRNNDSIINAMARLKADSILATIKK